MKIIKHGGEDLNTVFEEGSRILTNNQNVAKYFDIKEVEIFKIIKDI